jgi:hypothetical protein
MYKSSPPALLEYILVAILVHVMFCQKESGKRDCETFIMAINPLSGSFSQTQACGAHLLCRSYVTSARAITQQHCVFVSFMSPLTPSTRGHIGRPGQMSSSSSSSSTLTCKSKKAKQCRRFNHLFLFSPFSFRWGKPPIGGGPVIHPFFFCLVHMSYARDNWPEGGNGMVVEFGAGLECSCFGDS